jgi:hypothetical protein
MRRQGWALCLGMFLGGSVLAQPAPQEERFPPAPDLPGVVVSKPTGKTDGTVKPLTVQRASSNVTQTPTLPAPLVTTPVPSTNTITTTVVPVTPNAISIPATPCETCPTSVYQHCPQPGCATPGQMSHLPSWLTFRSQAKHSGKVPTPYAPPIYAWFPPGCVTNKPGAGACATPYGPCATGHCGTTVIPPMQYPVMQYPTTTLPVPQSVGPQPIYTTPTQIPNTLPTPAPITTPAETDPLAGFRKINDGLSFTPGGSPMAAPTKPVSRTK